MIFLLQPTTTFYIGTFIHWWIVHKRKFGSAATYYYIHTPNRLEISSYYGTSPRFVTPHKTERLCVLHGALE